MSAEVTILASYALALIGTAHGLRALGRRSTSPWASRTLAGHLRATDDVPEPVTADDWPHCEVPRLYAGMGLVAALAATALSIAGLALHHDALLLVVAVLSALTLVRLAGAALRH